MLDYGTGHYRVDVLRGNWVWEFDGEPFASVDEFVELVRSVRVVDDATWLALLPEAVVVPDDRAAVVSELLAGVTLPQGFDPATLAADAATDDRYQMIAEISGAVACAWLDDWFDAREAGDDVGEAEAAAGLATSRDWPMLLEIESQGGWSGAVWEYADAVNGGPGISSGAGPIPPDRANATSGLGCVFDGA